MNNALIDNKEGLILVTIGQVLSLLKQEIGSDFLFQNYYVYKL